MTATSSEKNGTNLELSMNQDPESGEGLDNIEPLFSDIGSKDFGAGGDSTIGVKPKYMEFSSIDRPVAGSDARYVFIACESIRHCAMWKCSLHDSLYHPTPLSCVSCKYVLPGSYVETIEAYCLLQGVSVIF